MVMLSLNDWALIADAFYALEPVKPNPSRSGQGWTMTRDSRSADVMAYLADREMDVTADYLERGRRFAALAVEELARAWTEAFRARLTGESLEGGLSNDLQAEHVLRGVELPLASLRAEIETYTRNVSALTKEAEAEIVTRFEESLERRAKLSN